MAKSIYKFTLSRQMINTLQTIRRRGLDVKEVIDRRRYKFILSIKLHRSEYDPRTIRALERRRLIRAVNRYGTMRGHKHYVMCTTGAYSLIDALQEVHML